MLLEVDRLSYRYPNGMRALCDVSFSLADGECVGLVGPNGAGKSTLLWHLNGLLPRPGETGQGDASPTTDQRGRGGQGGPGKEGRRPAAPRHAAVRVAGLPVEGANLAAVRRMVGLVFQDPDDQLFCPTVADDVAFGPRNQGLPLDEVRARVRESLAAVDLTHLADRAPHQLSVGERKRACLAGVLACRPSLMALDEPTANLDPRARRQLIGLLRDLPCARLIATHDLELVHELCTRAIVLDDSRVRADGPAAVLLQDESLLESHGLEPPAGLRSTFHTNP